MSTATLTKADAIEALQLYGQHHPDCAAVWPEKPCDCGLAALGVERVIPKMDLQRPEPEPLAKLPVHPFMGDPVPSKGGRKGVAERPGFNNGVANVQPRNKPKPRVKPVIVIVADTATELERLCTICHQPFVQRRRQARPFSKCPTCRTT